MCTHPQTSSVVHVSTGFPILGIVGNVGDGTVGDATVSDAAVGSWREETALTLALAHAELALLADGAFADSTTDVADVVTVD
jgi:hypothetical protein